MGLKFCALGSGSKGNCACVWSEKTNLLIDAGLSCARIEKCMRLFGIDPHTLSVLVTHSHVDHAQALPKLIDKFGVVVYAPARVCEELFCRYELPRTHLIAVDGDFFVGDLTISPFPLSHDVPCVGYSVLRGGKKISFATDSGKISDRALSAIADSDLVVLESNHDPDMLVANDKYPPYLKNRILSDRGHLSNQAAADCAVKLVMGGVKQIILAHLSQDNNLPELAFATVRDELARHGFTEGKDVKLEVATQDAIGSQYELV